MELPATQTPSASKKMLWGGWIITALPALLLVFSAVMKFIMPADAVEGFTHLGWPQRYALGLGIVELACTIIYLVPRTAVLGAILLTGYLGGATATHVRVGDLFFMTLVLGVLVWLGIYLREPRLRAIVPLRR